MKETAYLLFCKMDRSGETGKDGGRVPLISGGLYLGISLWFALATPFLLREGLWILCALAGPTWHLHILLLASQEVFLSGTPVNIVDLVQILLLTVSWGGGLALVWNRVRFRKKAVWILAGLWILSAVYNVLLFGLLSLM